jgi:hypothetical protein
MREIRMKAMQQVATSAKASLEQASAAAWRGFVPLISGLIATVYTVALIGIGKPIVRFAVFSNVVVELQRRERTDDGLFIIAVGRNHVEARRREYRLDTLRALLRCLLDRTGGD